MKYLKKMSIPEEWQNNLKTYFGLLFCVPISSAVAGKASRSVVRAYKFCKNFGKL